MSVMPVRSKSKLVKSAIVAVSVGVTILITEGLLTLYLAYFDRGAPARPRTEMPSTLEEALGSRFVYSALEGAPAWKGKACKMASFEDWYNLIPRFQLYEGVRAQLTHKWKGYDRTYFDFPSTSRSDKCTNRNSPTIKGTPKKGYNIEVHDGKGW